MKINDKIALLREEMKQHGMSAYIIPSSDAHMSEYVATHWQGRAYLSGFTGSAGTLVVTLTESGLWTDGRYFIQAEQELKGSEIKLFRIAQPNVPTINEYLVRVLNEGETVGFDGKCLSVGLVKEHIQSLQVKNVKVVGEYDLLDKIWNDRPAIPATEVFVHETQYTGYSCAEKLEMVRKEMKKVGSNGYVLTALGSIAWLFNVRGDDILFNPLVVSYAFVTETEAYLFVDHERLSPAVISYLTKNGVTLKDYQEIEVILSDSTLSGAILCPMDTMNYYLYNLLGKQGTISIIEGHDLVNDLKAIKNDTEIKNTRQAQIKDSVALVGAVCEVYDKLNSAEGITEYEVREILEIYRRRQPLNYGSSFGAIVAYGANAAMMHYNPTKENCSKLEKKGLLLIDSGGQYLDGTTDITRTFVLGPLTDEERLHYTLVLKGHINLSRAVFQKGCTGGNLDILARQPIWEYGFDYRCGTGHGVSYFGGVHEGPQGFRLTQTVPLKPGMMTTNEPGIYEEGRHGIRIENTLLVIERNETEYGQFYEFETISYFPIDTKAIVVELMTAAELEWLNNYHQQVFELLAPHLEGQQLKWLEEQVKPLSK